MPCIYKITNTINGKVYIGQTIQPLAKRWKQHKRNARGNETYSIHRAIAKYGEENFTIECLCNCSIEELDMLEKKYIKDYNSYSCGYNETHGGQGKADVKSLLSVKVVKQYTLKGEYITKYESCSEASRQTGYSITNIDDCCNNKIQQACGFLWCYEGNEHSIQPLFFGRVVSTRMKPVIIYNDKERHIFPSIRETTKFLKVGKNTIWRRCEGIITSPYKGYNIEYYKEY